MAQYTILATCDHCKEQSVVKVKRPNESVGQASSLRGHSYFRGRYCAECYALAEAMVERHRQELRDFDK